MGSWQLAYWVPEVAGLFPFVIDIHVPLSELVAISQAESYYQAALSKPQLQVEWRFFYNACLSNLIAAFSLAEVVFLLTHKQAEIWKAMGVACAN